MSIYTENGYSDREEYFSLLRLDYGEDRVNRFLSLYPPSEDFNGLITALSESYYNEAPFGDVDDDEEEEDEDDWGEDE